MYENIIVNIFVYIFICRISYNHCIFVDIPILYIYGCIYIYIHVDLDINICRYIMHIYLIIYACIYTFIYILIYCTSFEDFVCFINTCIHISTHMAFLYVPMILFVSSVI